MCGIAGIFAYDDAAPPADVDEVRRVCDAMQSRGPDGEGFWLSPDKRIALGHRRLAIIDVSPSGAQPMSTADGRLHVTFNGEIYNYRVLRSELESKGFRFRSNSDTEVLLHLYADRGPAMVEVLRGMFAFAIWDEPRQQLFLARDQFGIKPLYIADDGRTVRFASQVKALLNGGAVDRMPDPAGAVGFLVLGSVPDPHTLYRAIRALPAGRHVTVSRRGAESPRAYFDLAETLSAAETGASSPSRETRHILVDALKDTVRHHLIADVPVGLFLSAGIDSTTLAAVSVENHEGSSLKGVTLGFREFEGTRQDEVPLAAEVAKELGIAHDVQWITRDDFVRARQHILGAMDQPSIDGVNTYFVSRAASRAGMKVALSGLGGDELFGGYPSFTQVPSLVSRLRMLAPFPAIGRALRAITAPLVGTLTSPKYAGVAEYGTSWGGAYLLRRALFMPWEVRACLDRATVSEGLESLGLLDRLNTAVQGLRQARSRIVSLELGWYMRNQLLRDSDWAGMAHSLEIRVPLVDVTLFTALAPLLVSPQPPGKRDLATVLERCRVSPSIVSRPKTGFVTPVRSWVADTAGTAGRDERGLRNWARLVLAS